VHHAEMMPQFEKRRLPGDRYSDLAIGLSIFCFGLFKKVVIADSCAVYADAGFDMLKAGHPLDMASAWIAVVSYSFQIYYDFSGYSDMAVGLGRMFGIQLPVNFHSPYKATGIIDFWRRWHITLSRFLRDYLYVPLGGNRHGRLRQYANLSVVMLLGGLWHGANWTFVAWGAVHGVMLAVNHAWQSLSRLHPPDWAAGAARLVAIAVTFLAVTLAWVPFRAENLAQTKQMLRTLLPAPWQLSAAWASVKHAWHLQFGRGALDLMTWFKPRELWPPTLPPEYLASVRPAGLILLVIGIATLLFPNTQQIFAKFDPVSGLPATELNHRASITTLNWKAALLVSGMFVFSVLQLSRVSPFLYFQF
jgi:alginate O-acetyltransferase complex protein AlgI